MRHDVGDRPRLHLVPSAQQLLEDVAQRVVEADDAIAMTQRLLDVVHELIGFDVAYLTRIDWELDRQEVVASVRADDVRVDMPVGLRIDWPDTLCRRALDADEQVVEDAAERFPDSPAGRDLGIRGFVAVPVETVGANRPWGTLCAADGEPGRPQVSLAVLQMLSQLIGHAIGQEHARLAAVERAELAEERLAERLRFAASADHALRSPLGVITAWAELLGRDELDDEQRAKGLARIEEAARRMDEQLVRLVDESQSSLVDLDLDADEVAVHELVEDLVAAASTDGRAVRVSAEPVVIATDQRAVRLAVEQLLDNAVRHTPPGTSITVTVRPDEAGAVVVVRDDGPGLPEGLDVLAPFVSGSGRPGLGLHVVRTVTRALGGRTNVRSMGGVVAQVTFPDLAR